MDKDFLYKLVEHGVCQSVKILILINQGYKFLCGFLALLIAGNSLFQLRNFNLKCVLLFGILCIKRPISCIRQLAEGVVLIDFANQFFQFSGSLLSSSQTPALFRYIGTLLGNLRFLNSVNKFRPVISGIFSDSPERIRNQCQNSTLIDTVLCRA